MSRFVESVRLHRGTAVEVVSLQVANPGAVATYFLNDGQLVDLFRQAYVELLRAGREDPTQLLGESGMTHQRTTGGNT